MFHNWAISCVEALQKRAPYFQLNRQFNEKLLFSNKNNFWIMKLQTMSSFVVWYIEGRVLLFDANMWYCFPVCPMGGFNFQHVLFLMGGRDLFAPCQHKVIFQAEHSFAGKDLLQISIWLASRSQNAFVVCLLAGCARVLLSLAHSPAERAAYVRTQYYADLKRRVVCQSKASLFWVFDRSNYIFCLTPAHFSNYTHPKTCN